MTSITDKHMTRISERRQILAYPDVEGDGQISYIGMWVDGIQIATGLRQSVEFDDYHKGYRWQMWSSALTLPPNKFYGNADEPRADNAACPLAARDEADVRAWLNLFADLAERGPRAVDRFAAPAETAGDPEAYSYTVTIKGATKEQADAFMEWLDTDDEGHCGVAMDELIGTGQGYFSYREA